MQMAAKHLLTESSVCTRGYGIRSPEVSHGLEVLCVLLHLHQDVLESEVTIFFAAPQTELPLQQLMWQTRVCTQAPYNVESITESDFIMSMAALENILPLHVLCSPGAEHLVMFDTFRDQTTALARATNFRVRIP